MELLGDDRAHLNARQRLVADRFTVADLNVASVLSWSRGSKFDLSPWPNAAGWLDRCLSRRAKGG